MIDHLDHLVLTTTHEAAGDHAAVVTATGGVHAFGQFLDRLALVQVRAVNKNGTA